MREIFIDSFAGGGGASLGIKLATGRAPDIAINHDADAIAMHTRNHPETLHVTEDVFAVNLRKLVDGRPVGGFWASPDCRDFSRAKGGTPVSRRVRGLAWFVIKVAKQIRPRVIFLENVREFEQWGPVVPIWECRECDWKGSEGQATLVRTRRRCPRCESRKLRETLERMPDPDRRGITFKIWRGKLKAQGYRVEHQTLNAADYGAATNRKRLFLVARCDDQPIVWPEPTHAPPEKCEQRTLFGPKLQPYHTFAENAQWEVPCPSIFDRKKELQPKSHWRTAKGLLRYVLRNARPFIVPMTHAGERNNHSIDEPLPTITTANRGELGLVAASIAKFYGGVVGHNVDQPIGTITSVDHHYLQTAVLVKFRGDSAGADVQTPLPTITSGAGAARPAGAAHAMGIATAWLARFNHGEKQWNSVEEPLGTITTQGGKFYAAFAYLNKFYGSGGQGQTAAEPLGTTTVKARFAVVAVQTGEWCFTPGTVGRPKQVARWAIEQLGHDVDPYLLWVTDPDTGEVFPLLTAMCDGVRYLITDIGLRMLRPRELARCQGFPDSYLLSGVITNDVARIGNSVSPYPARALVAANFQFKNVRRRQAAGVK
jgi:DNA (cytosine-5)-methyltransferase 1